MFVRDDRATVIPSASSKILCFDYTTFKVYYWNGAAWVEAGGGAGNGPDSSPRLYTPPSSPQTIDDEFNDGANMSGPVNLLDAKWTKHNLGTASWLKFSNTQAPGAILFDIPTGQAADQAIYQTTPAGDFTLLGKFQVGNMSDRQMWGLLIVDSAGTGVMAELDDFARSSNPASFGVRTVTTWANGATAVVGSIRDDLVPFTSLPVYVWLEKVGGVYTAYFAWGDNIYDRTKTVFTTLTTTPGAFTPAFVGIGRIFGTGSARVAVDFFRKVP